MLNGGQKLPTRRLQDTKKTLGILISLIFFITTSSIVLAEEWKPADEDTSLGHFPTKLAADLSNIFTQENLPILIVGSMVTAFDWGAYDSTNQLAPDLVQLNAQPLFDFGNFYGEGRVEGGAALGSWSLGAMTNDPKLQEFGRDATESLIYSTLLVEGLKYSVNRPRPDGSNNQSFPSGHAIAAFCFAPVVQKYWGWEAGIPAYVLATVTAFARVEGYHHYLSDVMASATLGIILGNSVVYTPKDFSVSAGMGQVNLKLAFN